MAHGAFNLWEGNWLTDKLLGDVTHGSGSHQTAFRNRIVGDNGTGDQRTCISIEYYNRYWNVVGNVLGKDGLQNKRVSYSGSTSEGTTGSILKMGGEVNINDDYSPSDAYSYTSGMFVLDHGNYDTVTDGQVWESSVSDHSPVTSYLYASKPTWFGDRPWPPFEAASAASALTAKSYTNTPAGYRYEFGTDPPAGSPSSTPHSLKASSVNIKSTLRGP
jgi:hypothetical protein